MKATILGASRRRPSANRGGTPQSRRTGTPSEIRIVASDAVGNVLTVTFDQPVVLSGVPAWRSGAMLPVAADLASATVMRLTYPGPAGGSGSVAVPFDAKSISSATGGFVPAQTISLAAEAAAASTDAAPAMKAA